MKNKTLTVTLAVMLGETSKELIREMNEVIKNGEIEMEQKQEKDHDFFYLDDANQKQQSTMVKNLKRKAKPYTSTRIKARNVLSNIAYSGVKAEDFVNSDLTFEVITLLTKSINLFSLERKITDAKNRDIIYMFWEEYVEKSFYKHICENDCFVY